MESNALTIEPPFTSYSVKINVRAAKLKVNCVSVLYVVIMVELITIIITGNQIVNQRSPVSEDIQALLIETKRKRTKALLQ